MLIKSDDARNVTVSLSRRNLLDLLAILDVRASQKEGERRITSGSIHRYQEDGAFLRVTPEEDDLHYADRAPGPGAVDCHVKLAEASLKASFDKGLVS